MVAKLVTVRMELLNFHFVNGDIIQVVPKSSRILSQGSPDLINAGPSMICALVPRLDLLELLHEKEPSICHKIPEKIS